MIQRIQSLYLLLALTCTGLFFFLPFGEIILADGSATSLPITGAKFSLDSGTESYSMIPLLIMFSIVNLTTFISIFLFKRRMFQIRLNVFNLIMQVGSIGLCFYYLVNTANKFGTDYSTSILVILPAIAAIFTFLAIRAIAKDEALVRSVSRLR